MKKGSLRDGSRVRHDGGVHTDFGFKVTSSSAKTPFRIMLGRYHGMFG